MSSLLEDPMVQAGVAPFLLALIVGMLLARTRLAWLAVLAGYLGMVALTTGFGLDPLTVSRKVVLGTVLAALAGLAAGSSASDARARALALVAGIAAVLAFTTVLAQRETPAAVLAAAGIALFVAALCWATSRLRADGVAMGAAGVGLGLATGLAAMLSASIGFFMSGVAIAAASGAMLVVQIATGRSIAAGLVGALTLSVGCGLFAGATLMLAQLPWYALPLIVCVPLAVSLAPAPQPGHPFRRAVACSLIAIAAAALPVFAAWLATRGASA
jgi:hypothetical protein